MDDHPTEDTTMRDALIVGGLVIFMYVTVNITPISLDAVVSGQAPASILAFFGVSAKLAVVQDFFLSFKNILVVMIVFFLAGSFWTTLKIMEIHHGEHEKYKPIKEEEISAGGKTTQWQGVLDYVNSESPAAWKLAILEADNMFDEILEEEGYVGETLADKLKEMSRTRITSYDDVWEAHKLRNQIAHGGAMEMDLSKKIARDTIAKFENAFKELGYL